jgi:hypothetical protein
MAEADRGLSVANRDVPAGPVQSHMSAHYRRTLCLKARQRVRSQCPHYGGKFARRTPPSDNYEPEPRERKAPARL